MDTTELSMDRIPSEPDRVVEAELKLPRVKDLKLPEVDLEPARKVAKEVLLTGIGMAVLMARGVRKAVRAAREAGSQAAEAPGPVTSMLMGLVRERPEEKTTLARRVPILPIANYDTLAVPDLLDRLGSLQVKELEVVLTYERAHLNRPHVVAAIVGRLPE